MLVASAIQLTTGEVYVGKRHCDCFSNLIEINRLTGKYTGEELMKLHIGCTQGFITDNLVFLNRYQAEHHAWKCKQITDTKYNELLSEDLW